MGPPQQMTAEFRTKQETDQHRTDSEKSVLSANLIWTLMRIGAWGTERVCTSVKVTSLLH
jgi:hypothetical protein